MTKTDTLYSTKDAAAAIGASASAVRRICKSHGVGRLLGRDRVLTSADVERLKGLFHGRPGNPNMVPGNHFGKPPKKVRKKSG